MVNTNSINAQSKCSRCGQTRIVVSAEKEIVNNSVIIRTTTACPDKDCQAIVDQQLEKDRLRREQIEQATIARQVVRK